MGMPEYHDGSFGPIKPLDESIKDLLDARTGELEKTRALHIGQLDDLVARAGAVAKINEVSIPTPPGWFIEEIRQLRMDLNKIMIHLGIDDKTAVLPVKDLPKER